MIEKLVEKGQCTGCTACENICPVSCISMISDQEGFLQPQCNHDQCIKCGRCLRVCPALHSEVPKQTTECYAAYSMNEQLRMDSSSGGIFSELAIEMLRDGGIVFGAAYDSEWNVHHICVEQIRYLQKLRGAKYSQSDLGSCFRKIREILNTGRRVLFAGTPCQTAGLRNYLGKNYRNLLLVDFVCHGVPSPGAWAAYVRYRAEQDSAGIPAEEINLRSKRTGWSHYQYSNVYRYPGGMEYTALNGDDLFMKLFVGDCINRRCCADCKFKGYDRISDVTLGDFWGIWDIAPEMDDDKGTSLVLIHSDKGREIWSSLKSKITVLPVSKEQTSAYNESLTKSSPEDRHRRNALSLALENKYGDIPALLYGSMQKRSKLWRRVLNYCCRNR